MDELLLLGATIRARTSILSFLRSSISCTTNHLGKKKKRTGVNILHYTQDAFALGASRRVCPELVELIDRNDSLAIAFRALGHHVI